MSEFLAINGGNMMKRIIAILMVLAMMLSFAACGNNEAPAGNANNDTETSTGTDNSEGNKKDPVDSNVSFTQSETVLGYTIMCPENCSVSNSKYGKAFSYGSDFSVIIEAPASVGNVFTVSGIEEAVSSCEEYVCASLESRNIDLFHTGATEQSVSEKKTVTVAGGDALKVTGAFKNTQENTETNYVAYYLLATSSEGASYPIYIVGITLDGSETELSAFMDDMASQIKK
jgi:predicted small lipoprotein YifL